MRQLLLFLLLISGLAANAQTCTTATCTAAGVTEAQFLAALPAPGNTNATVVVNIPSGSSTWTTGFVYTIPTAVTNLTIQGATTVTFTGTAGAANYAATATDSTTITDGATGPTPLQNYITQGTGQHFRITGMTINLGTTGGANSKYGEILLDGNSANFRMDHMHFICTVSAGADIRVESSVYGVLDHNLTNHGGNTDVTNSFQVFSGNDTLGLGDGEFAQATPWGTASAVYIEANIFHGGASNDCYQGGYFVERYNTIDSAYVGIQTHGTKSTGGPYRSCRGYEAYHNYFSNTVDASTPASGSTGAKGATALVWGNITSQQAAYRFFEAAGDRNSGDEVETNSPNGWGYCGSTANGNGVGSPWDGNQPNLATGYPCLDGLGRGQSDALNATVFPTSPATTPTRLDSVTGTITWPHQKLEPIYLFMNTLNSSGTGNNGTAATEMLIQDDVTNANRDYYYDCGSNNTDGCSGSFTGASGTGFGVLSARPTACTAGPGGTYGGSPTGSYGVAYWATDANSGNGELYVCTASGSPGTWTAIYQPYTYPHPLISGGLTSTSTSLSPSNFTPVAGTNITLTASITPSSGPTGTVTFFDGGSSIGTGSVSSGTATHTVTAITAGSHTYTATYGGDSSYSSSTSSGATVAASGPSGSIITGGTTFKGGVVIK